MDSTDIVEYIISHIVCRAACAGVGCLELLRGGSGHSHSISASRLGGLSGQNATVAPILSGLIPKNTRAAPDLRSHVDTAVVLILGGPGMRAC